MTDRKQRPADQGGEKTAKVYKAQQLAAVLIMGLAILGVFLAGASDKSAAAGCFILLLLICFVWYGMVTARNWWHHG